MQREKIKLENYQWRDLVQESYLEKYGKDVDIEIIENQRTGSYVNTISYQIIFRRLYDSKFFKLDYEMPISGNGEWEDYNVGDTHAIEVFPELITKTIYK